LTARHRACADSMSLNAIVMPAAREPGPLVTRWRSRTVVEASGGNRRVNSVLHIGPRHPGPLPPRSPGTHDPPGGRAQVQTSRSASPQTTGGRGGGSEVVRRPLRRTSRPGRRRTAPAPTFGLVSSGASKIAVTSRHLRRSAAGRPRSAVMTCALAPTPVSPWANRSRGCRWPR